ncbi:hypothetical protein MMC27_000462 [Xylographa pallens]|nr:hypothetical protein [Xylographa pallens]
MSSSQQIQGAFEASLEEFSNNLIDKNHYDFSKIRSIDDVYDETDRIQKLQGSNGALRNLKRIEPYLRCINEYSSVIETFVLVKPDLLALLWGPIKFLLQVTSTYIKSFDKLLDMTVRLADALPQFKAYEELFRTNTRVTHVLCLFYKDILDFYAINLNYFKAKGWKIFHDVMLSSYTDKIAIVQENIIYHKELLSSEVTVADIRKAFAAHSLALKEYENNSSFREQQDFDSMKVALAPRLYDVDLEQILESRCRNTCKWVFDESLLRDWSIFHKDRVPILWLSGIPGAGKTHLAASIIEHISKGTRNAVFAFLRYQDPEAIRRTDVYHSFIFQLLFDHKSLRPALQAAYKSSYRQLLSSVEFVLDLLHNLFECVETVHIIVDGLDEINRAVRSILLQDLIDLCDTCPNVKLLLCSRKESDISRLLRNRANTLVLGQKNTPDIECYVYNMIDEWISTVDVDPLSSVASEVRTLVKPVAARSKGMFLYARLVMVSLTGQPDLYNFKREAQNLPNGLEEAYGRIIDRVKNTLSTSERCTVEVVLKWIACSRVLLRKEELHRAIMIQQNDTEFNPDRRIIQNIVQLCGPIVEMQGDFINFVHFTVKEFLCSSQSHFFIDKAAAHRQLSMTCISYLGFNALGDNLSDSSIDTFLLNGSYVLLFYVKAYWLDHTKEGLRVITSMPVLEDLCRLLSIYFTKHPVPTIVDTDDVPDLLPLKGDWPAVYQSLCAVDLAQKKSKMTISSCHSENECIKQKESLVHGLDDCAMNETLLSAIELGHQLLVSSLLTRVMDCEYPTNMVDWPQVTSRALRGTNVAIVEMLLSVPIDVRRRTELKMSWQPQTEWIVEDPIYEAVEGGSTEIVEWLLRRDPKTRLASRRELMTATMQSGLDMMRLMLLHGILLATETLCCLTGTAYKLDCPLRELEMAELLLEYGANIREAWLNPRCSIELATFIVDKGASINLRKPDRSRPCTALYDAVAANTRWGAKVAEMLLENGADPNITCGRSGTMRDLSGAKNFQKRLGITFDDLVDSTQGVRQQVHDENLPSSVASNHLGPEAKLSRDLPLRGRN